MRSIEASDCLRGSGERFLLGWEGHCVCPQRQIGVTGVYTKIRGWENASKNGHPQRHPLQQACLSLCVQYLSLSPCCERIPEGESVISQGPGIYYSGSKKWQYSYTVWERGR